MITDGASQTLDFAGLSTNHAGLDPVKVVSRLSAFGPLACDPCSNLG